MEKFRIKHTGECRRWRQRSKFVLNGGERERSTGLATRGERRCRNLIRPLHPCHWSGQWGASLVKRKASELAFDLPSLVGSDQHESSLISCHRI
jgi:hypothetical protein